MEEIKKLREITGAGMVDCQKALKEASGNLDTAIEILRKKGIAKAAKRTDRETNEGVIKVGVSADGTEAFMLELNSETDFVARNEKFQAFADALLKLIESKKPASVDDLLALDFEGMSVKDTLDNMSGTIGEKMGVKRIATVKGASVAVYSHLGGRLGVLVALDQADKTEVALEVAMQVAAANPKYIRPDEVASDELAKEKEIYREQLIKEGKPENMVDKIVEGKVAKYYSEVCLLEQEFIKDDKKKVKDILAGASVVQFVRFAL